MLVLQLKYASFSSDVDVQVDKYKIPSKEKRRENLKQVQNAFYNRLHINRPWALSLVFCEILNAINLCLQIFILDVFFGGAFMNLGMNVAGADFSKEADPLEYIFPKVTKCLFHKYGPSGTIQNHDALCVMGLNVINEKIYTFLWFWFVILTIASILGLLWRLLTLLLHSRSETFNSFVFRATSPQSLDPWDLVKVTDECHFSDWLFLHYLGKNLDAKVFRELFLGLASQITEKSKPDRFYLRGEEICPLNGE
ncbi:hypothetical protein C0J52_02159 [Blattella germanica]|nr:hypothetical protein C0J52_02159 [Blattella germanica]